jgi:hypothetical protein
MTDAWERPCSAPDRRPRRDVETTNFLNTAAGKPIFDELMANQCEDPIVNKDLLQV